MADYESMKSKFQILDTFHNFYKYIEHNLKLWLIKNKVIYVIQIWDTFNIFFKYLEHNMELWIIKNGDVPDLATSLYNIDHYKSIKRIVL